MLAVALVVLLLAAPAGSAERPLRVLVTGDSMVEPLDRELVRPVKRAGGKLIRDPRPGTAITKPLLLNWVEHAKRQMKKHRPGATVVFLGANDAEPLRGADGREVECCRRAWIDAYARRVAQIMRTYRRGGAGRAYWLTLPAPRRSDHARVFAAVNVALAQAAAEAGEGARLIDTVPAISPGNRFRRTIEHRGRRVVVRDKDGVHLTAAGARIVRELVLDAMRADGAIG